MAESRWLKEASEDFNRLHSFLEAKDIRVAKRAALTVLKGVQILENSPEIGRPRPDGSKLRELFLSFGSGAYVIRYMIENEHVVITRIWHSREDRK